MRRQLIEWVRMEPKQRPRGQYFLLEANTSFPKHNRLTLEGRVLSALYAGFSRWWFKIKYHDSGSPYGCNYEATI
ncbi:hypothetical protein OSTOST_25608 [Ostertagia ostertagi]